MATFYYTNYTCLAQSDCMGGKCKFVLEPCRGHHSKSTGITVGDIQWVISQPDLLISSNRGNCETKSIAKFSPSSLMGPDVSSRTINYLERGYETNIDSSTGGNGCTIAGARSGNFIWVGKYGSQTDCCPGVDFTKS